MPVQPCADIPIASPSLTQLDRDGFVVLSEVFDALEVDGIREDLVRALNVDAASSLIQSERGCIYGARNILELWPRAVRVWQTPVLISWLTKVLGPEFGLVRVLYFDKPPGGGWALPWHKDLTIAVHDNRLTSMHFTKPTFKAGVPHVQAPLDLLNRMVTARIHLDQVTEENGPLRVIPGSHRTGKILDLGSNSPQSVLANSGDVLLIRPLVAHCSNRSHPKTTRHRRILHLEFAVDHDLFDGYAWHQFHPVN
ncbi:MAG: phytanoyl-CoA dioxygenase family protein [Gemmataceae bacterium]